ncbi:hypothetical protein KP509_06G022600 [Ceratopteris richardii]|uniref:Heparan-alpha-glucosaminide N-acetyltransferase catalytic domain-containing protein n=1 Tax=Ceratopteris richardii TaxID=49495 RepID=A0A8T2UQR2_CERRI|nr:hypothetical protein KP509_06G022600 [Ceratopteris richardii]KAH7434549.1 hypothetical protein KP509_06G022600 [Ceratopteris richardii]KAH7434551.1 hypothetical protein KP509_06G022600 [Ceratopteris richardii]
MEKSNLKEVFKSPANEEEGLMLLEKCRNRSYDLESGRESLLDRERSFPRANVDLAVKPFITEALQKPKTPVQPCKQARLVSLDVFRGMTVAAMILVDFGGSSCSALNHSPWDGVTFADFVVPAFLFIVGVSLTLTLKAVEDKSKAAYNILHRTLKILVLGLILQGGYIHGVKDLTYGVDLQFFRIMGVLQRIAIAYAIVAFFEVRSSANSYMADANESFSGILRIYHCQCAAVFVLIAIYLGLLYGIYVPDWQFELLDGNKSQMLEINCNIRGSMSPGCNAVGYVDRLILGISHLYKRSAYRRTQECSVNSPLSGPLPINAPAWCEAPFDPEGLLSTIPAIVTCFIGAHYGHVLLHMKGPKRQLWHWTASGFILMFLGLLLNAAGMPLNKQLYTVSYMFVTTGIVALAFTATFVLVDIYKWRSSTAFFKWVGMHSLMIYALLASDLLPILLQGFYWRRPDNNLIQILLRGLGF